MGKNEVNPEGKILNDENQEIITKKVLDNNSIISASLPIETLNTSKITSIETKTTSTIISEGKKNDTTEKKKKNSN
jgi:hypothetical protein